jgi:hypothetical protein
MRFNSITDIENRIAQYTRLNADLDVLKNKLRNVREALQKLSSDPVMSICAQQSVKKLVSSLGCT